MDNLNWLAGWLEGEGSFLRGPPSSPGLCIVSAVSTDEDVIAKVAGWWGVKYHPIKSRENHHKQAFVLKKSGKGAADLMVQLRPLMGRRRQEQIDRALSSYSASCYKVTEAVKTEVLAELAKGRRQAEVAAEFGLSRETVCKINTKSKLASSIPVRRPR